MLELTTLPDDFLINPVAESNGHYQSDFLLRGLRLRNTGDGPLELLRLELGLRAGGRPVRQVVYAAEALSNRLALLPADVGHLEGWVAQLVWAGSGSGIATTSPPRRPSIRVRTGASSTSTSSPCTGRRSMRWR